MTTKHSVLDFYHSLELDKQDLLKRYAQRIHEVSRVFNITGHKNEDDIFNDLVLGSLKPLCSLNVPRGTLFADIGTGGGVPGVPLAIVWPSFSGSLLDSSHKKTSFLKELIRELGLGGLSVVEGRVEEIALEDPYREGFNYVFSRALGDWRISIEAGGAMLKLSGYLYIYGGIIDRELRTKYEYHADLIGLSICSIEDQERAGFGDDGLLLRKMRPTPKGFPRRLPAILREK